MAAEWRTCNEPSLRPLLSSGRSNKFYGALSSGPSAACIRVLDLYSNNGDVNQPLRGTLRIVDLLHHPRFSALSYVWGPWSNPRHKISCGGFDVEITANCHEALLSLRNLFGALTIWVDSICINQADETEKSTQVPLMEKIYASAQPTYIWLGSGSPATDRAVECIELSSRLRIPPVGVPWAVGGETRTVSRDRQKLVRDLLRVWARNFFFMSTYTKWRIRKKFNVDDFSRLLESEWLDRAWTFQEIILASRPVLVRGVNAIEWQTFFQGLDFQDDVHEPFSYESTTHEYWMRRYRLYDLPKWIIRPWKDLMVIWLATPRRLPCSGNIDDESNQQETWSVNTYFYDNMRNFLHWVRLSLHLLPISFFFIPFCVFESLLIHDAEAATFRLAASILSPLLLCPLLLYHKPRELPLLTSVNDVQPQAKSEILEILRVLRTRQSTEPKDKSFAIQGILQQSGHSRIQTDYSETLGQIYLRLFIQLLVSNPYLISLLLDAGLSDLDAPSWVPDWSTIERRVWLHHSYIYQPIEDWKLHKKPECRIEGRALSVRGVWRSPVTGSVTFPKLERLERMMSRKESPDALYALTMDILGLFAAIGRCSSDDLESRAESMQNALSASRIRWGEQGADADEMADAWFDEYWPSIMLLSQDSYCRPRRKEIHDFLRGCPWIVRFMRTYSKRLRGIRGIFFADPDIIGSGPPSTLKGDRIANIVGVSVPLILREVVPHSERYRVVGPAFADTLMEWGWIRATKPEKFREFVPGDERQPGRSYESVRYVEWPGCEKCLCRTMRFSSIELV